MKDCKDFNDRALRCAFADFWPGWDPANNWMLDCINSYAEARGWAMRASACGPKDSPDAIFCSSFGSLRYHLIPCAAEAGVPVIYFTGENDWPCLDLFDYSVSMKPEGFSGRNLYLPLFLPHSREFPNCRWDGSPSASAGAECAARGFCSAVVSNAALSDPRRMEIWRAVAEIGHVASGGRLANNVGGPVGDKMAFISGYKFNLALENSREEGYVTEKITDALFAGTVPIYWGAPDVARWLSPESYIDVGSFPALADALEHIRKVDADDALYMGYLRANPFSAHDWTRWEDAFAERALEWIRAGRACQDWGRSPLLRDLECRRADCWDRAVQKRNQRQGFISPPSAEVPSYVKI